MTMKQAIAEQSSRIAEQSNRIDVLALEMRALGAEMRAGFAETRMALVGFETKLGGRINEVDRSVETVIDSLADFRNEYHQHIHE